MEDCRLLEFSSKFEVLDCGRERVDWLIEIFAKGEMGEC